MAEVTLKKRELNTTEFVVNLENEKTGEIEKYVYNIRRLGGKAGMKLQLLNAEFARDKKREEIVGSTLVKEILDLTSKPNKNTPDLLDLFDYLDDKGLEDLLTGMINAAKSSTVGDTTEPKVEQPAPAQG